MDDLASLNGRPRKFAIGGKEYEIWPLTLADLGDLQAWVDAQWPDPIKEVLPYLGQMTPEQQKFMLKEAHEAKRKPKPKLGQAEADAMVQSIEGVKELLYLSIRKGDPGFTREKAAELYAHLDMRAAGDLFATTGVIAPPGDDGGPKVPAPTG